MIKEEPMQNTIEASSNEGVVIRNVLIKGEIRIHASFSEGGLGYIIDTSKAKITSVTHDEELKLVPHL
jgi:hypothetical protein